MRGSAKKHNQVPQIAIFNNTQKIGSIESVDQIFKKVAHCVHASKTTGHGLHGLDTSVMWQGNYLHIGTP